MDIKDLKVGGKIELSDGSSGKIIALFSAYFQEWNIGDDIGDSVSYLVEKKGLVEVREASVNEIIKYEE